MVGERSKRLGFEPEHAHIYVFEEDGKCFMLGGTDLWSLKEKQCDGKGTVWPACHCRMMDEANSMFVISDEKLLGARMYPSYSKDPPEELGLGYKVSPFPDNSVYAHLVQSE